MARTTGETIKRAFELQDAGYTRKQIAEALHNTNIGVYITLRSVLDRGEMPPDKGSAYSLAACKDYIENYWNKPEQAGTKADDTPDSELSAKDKKELAMYALDQYLFFKAAYGGDLMSNDLKKCPFCGNNAIIVNDINQKTWVVHCESEDCLASIQVKYSWGAPKIYQCRWADKRGLVKNCDMDSSLLQCTSTVYKQKICKQLAIKKWNERISL